MIDINILKNTGLFKEIILEKGEVLFYEGDINNNIYIILIGELIVEKYTTKQKNNTKKLAYLGKNEIFGEASLNNNKPKEVNIIANRKSILLSLDVNKNLNSFLKNYPKEALNFLKYIIFLGNNRLSEANYLITASYNVSNEIIKIKEINNKSIFGIINILNDSIDVDYIMYYEVNPVLEKYVTLKYDTRYKNKMLNSIIELSNSKLDILELGLKDYNKHIQNLSIGNITLGYLVFLKKDRKFTDSDKKVITTTSTSLAGLIKQKQLLDEDRDMEFIKE